MKGESEKRLGPSGMLVLSGRYLVSTYQELTPVRYAIDAHMQNFLLNNELL